MDPYQDFAQQNEDRNQLGWQLENPMYDHFSMKKGRSPFFGPNPFWVYQDSATRLQNEAKKQGSIGVEITEPIVRPIGYQSSAEQNEAKRTGSLGAEIREPIVWPFSYQDSSGQNEGMGYTKKPLLIGVEIKEPVVRPVNFEEALVISQGKE